jgi:Ser/Thr protein kinase RdoA (MazF antagonist)
LKPYDELTKRGKISHLRHLAVKALDDYDLKVKWVKFLTIETNTMFKVLSEEGERFVLRIYSDEETTLSENQTELFWLEALKRDTDLNITEPVARRDGEFITIVTAPGVPGEKRCVLFKWVPGRALEEHLNPGNYFKLGETMAKLHDHAESLKPLPPFVQPKKWDKVFYYPDEPVVYNTEAYRQLFPGERIDLLEEVIGRANDEFARLYVDQERLMLIHGDLHYWNEDVMLAYPEQDIAITLYYGRQRDDYVELRTAFMRGYTSLRRWPVEDERQLQTLMAARRVNFINYVARIDASPQEYIQERCEELKRYLDRYG